MAERPIICVGDTTTHKGTVIEGFDGFDVYGRWASGVGHKVRCPKCPGIHTIIEGAEERTVKGVRIALEGMLTSCGATLIALQSNARIEIGNTAPASIAFGLGAEAIAEDHDSNKAEKQYDQHFHVLNEGTGEPLRHRRYRLTVDGLTFEGVTDSDGKAQRVSAAHTLSVDLAILPAGESREHPTLRVQSDSSECVPADAQERHDASQGLCQEAARHALLGRGGLER